MSKQMEKCESVLLCKTCTVYTIHLPSFSHNTVTLQMRQWESLMHHLFVNLLFTHTRVHAYIFVCLMFWGIGPILHPIAGGFRERFVMYSSSVYI